LVEKFSPKQKQFYSLTYSGGKYLFKKAEEFKMPLWPYEKYLSSGSFKKKGDQDVIITDFYVRENIEWLHYIRESKPLLNYYGKVLT